MQRVGPDDYWDYNEANTKTVKPTADTRQVLLISPHREYVPGTLRNTRINTDGHRRTLSEVQRLRGRIYVEEGAIEPHELTSDGRHCVEGDEESWHLLILDANGEVGGCARYLSHESTASFSRLGVRHAAAKQPEIWGQKLRWAIEADLQLARKRNVSYVEVGGWALREDLRCSTAAIRMVLSAYALARHLKGCIGVTTATGRHSSSTILRRLGGQPLRVGDTEMPSYYDPRYRCEMTILRFDSDQPNHRYEPWVEEIREHLTDALVVCPAAIRDTHVSMA
jgi:N-acyl-L-homoserine lactone synthetase